MKVVGERYTFSAPKDGTFNGKYIWIFTYTKVRKQ